MSDATTPVVEVTGVAVEFRSGDVAVTALRDASLAVQPGSVTALTGPSGAGKSTLLHVMSGLLTPTSGTVRFCGADLAAMDDSRRTVLRRRKMGFVFQQFHLMPALSAWENVALPAVLDGAPRRAARERAEELLATVGLADRSLHRPAQLSGGEMQRVAVARALISHPQVLFADEPTGNLDTAAGDAVMERLLAAARAHGAAVLLVTHDATRAAVAGRTISMRDGRMTDAAAESLA